MVLTLLAFFAMYITDDFNHHNTLMHRDATRELAKSYQTTHSNETPVTLNLDSDDETADTPLTNTPAKNKVTKVFYINETGNVVSGDKSDYHEALKSDNPVYVFVK